MEKLEKIKITPEQVTRFDMPKGVALSPDGKRIAFTVSPIAKRDGVKSSSVWLMDFNGEYFIKTFEGGIEPVWAPQGVMLAYIIRGKLDEMYYIDQNGNSLYSTEVPKGTHSLQWSPNGRFISFLVREYKEDADIIVVDQAPSFTRLYVLEIETNKIMTVSDEDLNITKYSWSPDSRSFVVSTTPSDNLNPDLVIIHRESGSKSHLMTAHDMTIMVSWSPDGKHIAWCGREHTPDSGQIMMIPIDKSIPKTIRADFPGSVKWLSFLPNGKLIFAALKNFRVGIYTAAIDGDKVEELVSPNETKPGSFGSGSFAGFNISISADGKSFATTISGPKEPGNVVKGQWGKSLSRITNFNSQMNALDFGETKEISWTAEDGEEINGLLVQPVNFVEGKQYPTIVEIHGGPRRSWWDTCYLSNSWAQFLASKGYMVLLPNPRGSSGRGAEFVRANNQDLGGKDFSDIMAGVDSIISKGYADPERLGIAGWSYGGFLTAWTITQTNRFKAAVMGASIVNWISWMGHSSMGSNWASIHWRAPQIAYHNQETLITRSPIHAVQYVKTPTLIMHGTQDLKIPSIQSDEFYTALKKLSVPVEYVKYSGEGHGIMKQKNQIDQMNRIAVWFEKYL